MFMEIASIVAKRSTCMRLNVGAVVVKDRRIISIGYNGSPSGDPHCLGNDCPGKEACTRTVHAEVNAISHAPPDLRIGSDLYVTDSPCQQCCNLIPGTGIRRVFFHTPYRVVEHLNTLLIYGVSVYRVTPAGYVFDWQRKELVEIET